jgi:hypothetical protein
VNLTGEFVDQTPTRTLIAPTNEDVGAFNLLPNGTALINVLHQKVVGAGDTQVTVADLQDSVGGLLKRLCVPALDGKTCGGARTREVVKAACGATLGSAATLVQ